MHQSPKKTRSRLKAAPFSFRKEDASACACPGLNPLRDDPPCNTRRGPRYRRAVTAWIAQQMMMTKAASDATVLFTGLSSWYMSSAQARWNATPAADTRNPNRNSDSFVRMLCAVAAASPCTTSAPRMNTWPEEEAAPSSSSKRPASLDLKRGDMTAT